VQQNASEDTVDLIPLEVGGERLALLRLFYDSESPVGLNSGVHVSCNFPGSASCRKHTAGHAGAELAGPFDSAGGARAG